MSDAVATKAVPIECMNCHTAMQSPAYCFGCRRLYPLDGLSIFDLFGLPRRHDLAIETLRGAYLRLTREVHPDRVLSLSEADQAAAQRLTARINQGFEVLSHPVRRAEYLLELCGGPSAAEDKTVAPGVLAETLMTRESIDDFRAAADRAGLDAVLQETTQTHREILSEIELLARGLPGDESTRSALRERLNTIKYYERILEQL